MVPTVRFTLAMVVSMAGYLLLRRRSERWTR